MPIDVLMIMPSCHGNKQLNIWRMYLLCFGSFTQLGHKNY